MSRKNRPSGQAGRACRRPRRDQKAGPSTEGDPVPDGAPRPRRLCPARSVQGASPPARAYSASLFLRRFYFHYGGSANRMVAVAAAPSSRSTTCTSTVDEATEILRGVTWRSARRGPRPDGPERLRASRRWPTPCSANPAYEVTAGPDPSSRARTSPTSRPTSGPRGPLPRLPAPRGDPRRLASSTSCARRWRPARASTTSRCSRCAWRSWSGRSASAWTTASRSATSTRASPAARRSATRSCRWRCSSPRSPSSTRPTPASTSTRCGVVAEGIARGAPGAARARHPAHHALPAHPRPPHPRRRARALDGRIVARPAAPSWRGRVEAEGFEAFRRGRGMRAMSSMRSTSRAIKADFPILDAGERQAARLPRLRGHRRRSRSPVLDAMDRLLPRRTTPTSTAACTRSPRRRPPRSRRARAKVAALRRRAATRTRSSSCATPPRPSTWSRTPGRAPTSARATSSCSAHMEHHANVVPWHMLAAERGVELRWIPLTADYRLDLDRPRPRCSTAPSCSRSPRCRTCSARSTTSARSPTPPTPPARTCSSTPCQAVPHVAIDVQAWDADFVGLLRPQDVGPTGIGALWARARAARGDAAVPRRRRDDHRRPPRRLHAQRGAVEVRGRHAADRRGGRLRRRRRLPRHGSAWTPSARTRCAHRATRSTRCSERFGDRLTIYGPLDTAVRGGAVSFLFERHPRPRHLPGARRGRRLRPGRPPLRQAADARARRPRHHPGVVLRLQRRSRRRRPRRRARRAPRSSSLSRAVKENARCPASKTSTARSSSTTTARRGTAASCRCRRPHKVEGFNPLCGDEVVLYLDVDDGATPSATSRSAGRAARSARRRRR